MKKHWSEKLNEILVERGGSFGHNTEVNIRPYLHKVDVVSFGSSKIEVMDYYTVRITLPSVDTDNSNMGLREKILLHVLTTSPMPTECRFNKKKDQLTIEWHY